MKQKITKNRILKIAEKYDHDYRGGTYRGMIDEELAEVLADVLNGETYKKAINKLP